MKITKIEIKNFKTFRGPDAIDLSNKGQNLLLYGENGSGKTSLYEALKFFLESSEGTHQFRDHRNIFTDETDKGYVKLHFTPDSGLNKEIYEMVKKRKSEDKNWKAAELYCGKVDGYDIPVYVEDKTYLERAREYLDANDYKACAVYVRTAYEATIKGYCENNNVRVKYREDKNELNSNDFWTEIKEKKITDPKSNKQKRLLKLALVKKIELARKFTLNPLSHANIVNIPRKELEDAIEAVEWLEDALT